MFLITTICVIALAAIHIVLSVVIIKLRRRHKIGVGSAGNRDLAAAMRAQANNLEYAIWFMPLMALAEMAFAEHVLSGLLWALAVVYLVARVLHARAFIQSQGAAPPWRVYGTALTLAVLLGLAILNIAKFAL